MNPKNVIQTAPLIVTLATVAPPLLVGSAIGLGLVLLIKVLSDDDQKGQPEAAPTKPELETNRKPAETAVFRSIPAPVPAESTIPSASASTPSVNPFPQEVPRPAVVRPVSTTAATKPLATPPPITKRFITRADMAAVFENGNQAMSRTAAVSSMRKLGFGKSAAYAALSPNGRFSGWLAYAPDGIISWTGGQKV